ncbi:MAG: inositol-3-phosphate synthase [Bacteroidales bacterium]|jgi:myo-inositol-1-phosphate synthase|nr:inositol-3-phosphate synthase [Bacteroidales bacterium]
MKTIKIAIVGVGNCASALIQGLEYYGNPKNQNTTQGMMAPNIGGYTAQDIEVVAAFDVDIRKVGQTLDKAIYSKPNCTINIVDPNKFPKSKVVVQKGHLLDGVSQHMKNYPADNTFLVDEYTPEVDVVQVLKQSHADILINYLPVGSEIATKFYAQCAIDAGVAFLNCIPIFIASNPEWEEKFINAGLPLIGDDMKSQFGASILSQMLQELAFARGHKVKCHIQENVGGNTDFLNMLNTARLKSKKISKENVIRCQHDIRGLSCDDSFLYAGPSNYIRYYGDNKVATFHLELEGFGGSPVTLDARLSVIDSPNSAGVVIDAIRYLKVAKELGITGSLHGASAFTQKTPPYPMTFEDAQYECRMLANRKLTKLTQRQANRRKKTEYIMEAF